MSVDEFNDQPPGHRTAEEIVAYVLKEPMSTEALADYIIHVMMRCEPCGKVTAAITQFNDLSRWTRDELVQFAETSLRVLLPPNE